MRIGLCGFTMAMEDYALHFPVVEVQHTFYEPPRNEVMQRWRAVTPPRLEYTMKVWQLVTHSASSPTYRRMKRPLAARRSAGVLSRFGVSCRRLAPLGAMREGAHCHGTPVSRPRQFCARPRER